MKTVRFENFKDYFLYQQSQRTQGRSDRKSDTLSRLVKMLGYKSPSLLSMISKGQRLPSAALLEALLDKWEVPQSDREGIRIQVEIERRLKKDKGVLHLLDRLQKIQGITKYKNLDLNQFQVVRYWYVYVLKELVGGKGFVEDPVIISRRLRGKVTPSQVKSGIEALLAVNLIKRNEKSGALESVVEDFESTNGIPSEAIQEHHRAMMERAIESITEQPVPNRHLHTLTFKFDPRYLGEAQQKIIEFIRFMNEKYQSEDSDRVFQMNVQFFEHTREGQSGSKI